MTKKVRPILTIEARGVLNRIHSQVNLETRSDSLIEFYAQKHKASSMELHWKKEYSDAMTELKLDKIRVSNHRLLTAIMILSNVLTVAYFTL